MSVVSTHRNFRFQFINLQRALAFSLAILVLSHFPSRRSIAEEGPRNTLASAKTQKSEGPQSQDDRGNKAKKKTTEPQKVKAGSAPVPKAVATKPLPTEKQLELSFKGADKDRDGQLNETEFVGMVAVEARPAAKRDLLVFDLDQNGKLTLAEYRNVLSRVPPTLRGTLPSPFATLLEERMASIVKAWAKWDTDQNGSLSEAEFQASKLTSTIPGLDQSTWKDWDRDGDGQLAQKDCRWLLEAAYGLRRMNGQLLYLPTGQIVYWWHFKGLDTNRDERLTPDEFFKQELDSKVLTTQFKSDDADQNGEISFKEWAESPGHQFDPIAAFLATDKNLDGQVDPAELKAGTDGWLQPLPDSVFPGFDLTADGKLSLDEFRSTLLMNRMENWLIPQNDIDHDGRLSLVEFIWTPGPELALLKAEYFRRLDVNRSEYLETKEFRFNAAPEKVSPEVALERAFKGADQDQDGQLNESEFVGMVADAARPTARRDLLVFDLNHDGKLTPAEYRNVLSRVPAALRGTLPSPFAKLVEERMAPIERDWAKWDTDQNDSLSEAEFQASKLATSITGLGQSTWKAWDRDGDGRLTQKECRWLLEAAYGLRRLDGQPLYLPTGQIVYWWHFKGLDTNQDQQVSREEFMKQEIEKEVLETQFKAEDVDQNEELSFKEWAGSARHHFDPIADFLVIDKNLDGQIDPAELKKETPGWLRPLAEFVFPGFDLDANGFLSLDEHRSTLINNRMEPWGYLQRDVDFDGRLSLAEFVWTPGLELSLLKAEYFRRFDVNQSGYLEPSEFHFTIDASKVPPEVVLELSFKGADKDQDGQLNETEFVSPVPEANRPVAKRDLLVFDLDRDGKLTLAEFRNVPSRVPLTLRGTLPSPFAKLLEERMAAMEKNWAQWDTDQNGTLSEAEFIAAELARSVPGLGSSTWKDWDRDADGSLSQKDCRWLLEAAYGLRRLDGQPLYLPNGKIVYWWHFKGLDTDHDERLTREEFMKQEGGSKALETQFKTEDIDQDGELSFKEWAESPGHQFDPIAVFLFVDKDLDGQVDPAELKAGTDGWLQPLPDSVFPGFDLDRDGKLSLDEYRSTLLMNRMEPWGYPQRDTDHDARLSPAEFVWTPGLELSLLKAEYFRRLDIDQSGFLESSEFQFLMDLSKASPQIILEHSFKGADKDRDCQLNETEFVGMVPEASQPAAKRDLLVFDQDRDGKLTLAEYRTVPSRVLPALRGTLASPFTKLLEERMAPIEKEWAKWDADQNGNLSEAEFQAANLASKVANLGPSTWKDWDRDGDGSVSQKDCRWLLEAAYGLRRLNGTPLYLPTGQIVYWWHFKGLDTNQDERVTREEFMKQQVEPKVLEAQFKVDDVDRNDEISFKEWAESPNHQFDPIYYFLLADKNLDGQVDPAELIASTDAWLQPVVDFVFPAFDLDADGTLSLNEHRTILAMNRLENWLIPQRDVDHDGRLSPAEFAWTPGLELSLMKAEYFRRLDINQSGYLELNEFRFTIDAAKVPPQIGLELSFKSADKDRDGQLNEAEFVSVIPEPSQPAAKRDFLVFDLDRDEKLTLAEFRNVPSRVPPALRGTLASPFAKLIEEQMASIEKAWGKWDTDQNGTLDEAELQTSELAQSIPGFPLSPWNDWDRDRDGSVSQKDCRWLLDAAYGLRRMNGQLLYLPTGQIVYWWHFKGLDTNRDERLTREEFMKQQIDPKVLETQFKMDDVDQDGELSFKEWAESPNHQFDPIAVFLSVDKNLDGHVDPAELKAGTDGWLQPLPDSVFPGFDLDADGKLSLDEYRSTLIMNRMEPWLVPQQDVDHDGLLSSGEFTWTSGFELSLLKSEYFRRLDVNRSGYLETKEFRFITDPAKVSPEMALAQSFKGADQDQDGQLNETEFVGMVSEASRPAAKRELLVFDLDHDGKLTMAEYRNVLSRVPPALRGTLPSPFAKLVDERMVPIEKTWSKWDADQNGNLNQVEFAASKLVSSIPGLGQSTWKDWDRDEDGSVSQQDCRWLLEAAYGLRRLDGQPLYLPTGQIVYWWHFKGLDTNQDERVTRDEFMKQQIEPKVLEAQFKGDDVNRNGEISFKEWAGSPGHQFDPIAVFLFVDKNLDGQVDPAELKSGTDGWLQPLSESIFPGFDLDADGKLSLDEYRSTLIMNRMEPWGYPQQDLDRDGRLSPIEFAWTPGLELSLLKTEYFRRLDVNHNGSLELNEFRFTTDALKVSPEVALEQSFKGADKDGDGLLNQTEFISVVPEASRPAAKRDLLVFDQDHDGKLTIAEFRTVPSRVLPAMRGALASPFAKLVEERMAQLSKAWTKWDTDQNGILNQSEFQESELARSIPGLALSPLKDWDRDGDGSLSQKDCRWLLEAAFGLRRLDGQLLYLPTGQIVYWWHFKGLDTNHDERVTREEFMKQQVEPKVLETQFKADDVDHNNEVSFKEWAESPNHQFDPIYVFLSADKNLDGQVDPAELTASTDGWLQPLAGSIFPGFDLNADGGLSLDEYRGTLIMNRMENWLIPQQDFDHDGRLSPAELAWTPGLELALLKSEYFRRLDVDKSGYLELNEFRFTTDPAKVPLKIVFQLRDRDTNGELTLEEVLGDLKPNPAVAHDAAYETRVARIEEEFQMADTDRGKSLSLNEFDTPQGRSVLNPDMTFKTGNTQSIHAPQSVDSSRQWLVPVLAFNVLLIVGVIGYLFMKR